MYDRIQRYTIIIYYIKRLNHPSCQQTVLKYKTAVSLRQYFTSRACQWHWFLLKTYIFKNGSQIHSFFFFQKSQSFPKTGANLHFKSNLSPSNYVYMLIICNTKCVSSKETFLINISAKLQRICNILSSRTSLLFQYLTKSIIFLFPISIQPEANYTQDSGYEPRATLSKSCTLYGNHPLSNLPTDSVQHMNFLDGKEYCQ